MRQRKHQSLYFAIIFLFLYIYFTFVLWPRIGPAKVSEDAEEPRVRRHRKHQPLFFKAFILHLFHVAKRTPILAQLTPDRKQRS